MYPTPTVYDTPAAKSTPIIEKLKIRPRQLQTSKEILKYNVETPIDSIPIEVNLRYIHPPTPPAENSPSETNDSKPSTKIIQKCTEPLSYQRDNYVHLISEDCEPSNSIFQLLIATKCLNLQDLWGKRPQNGQVLITSRRSFQGILGSY